MSRRGRPTLEQSEELTERIVAVAIEMFLEKGFAETTIDELAMRLGVAKRSLYSRFPSKAELFRAAANSYAASRIDALPPVEPDDRPPAEQLFDVCVVLLNYFLHPDIIAMERRFLAEAVRFPQIVPVLEDVRLRAMSRLDVVLSSIGADPEVDAQILWDLVVGPRMRAAALGLYPCAVTDETLALARQRIALFLAARREPSSCSNSR